MTKVIVRATDEGLIVPRDALGEGGEAEEFEIEITPLPGPREIQLRALAYVGRKLGSALGVEAPVREGDLWRVDVIAPDRERVLGSVYLDRRGELLPEPSATYESVRR
jgi:hypothetical protein